MPRSLAGVRQSRGLTEYSSQGLPYGVMGALIDKDNRCIGRNRTPLMAVRIECVELLTLLAPLALADFKAIAPGVQIIPLMPRDNAH